ncbi:PREDICTED: uncharacterized protein LOC108779187 [Cyphomyrmex costatus]|uniref:uncharacterized protein LOC108779187 n=1 Tax=Cyphomyrmex costatus TaxID=456900 RepID=UPI00085233A4|nr:PREDICTED: uncharacterized protein LOC108779187 [Cyphomyrmex costatus]
MVDQRDRNYQRILWVSDDQTVRDYQLATVTYGTASAPFLALRVLKQLLVDEGDRFPLASAVLKDNIYVDDVLFGAEDIPLLRQARDQVCSLLQSGGFKLRKWASNRAELLTDIPSDDHGLACNKIMQPDERLSVLGLSWTPALDVFQVHVHVSPEVSKTKRAILSTIARLFDPMGWVAPVIVAAKILMQQLWRCGCGWDDKIPPDVQSRWTSIYQSLSSIDGLTLPRWTSRGSDTAGCELHGFADASSVAYAAAVFMRVTSLSGEVVVTLLAAKSKVAPVRPTSVPRLELAAAVLLTRLMDFVRVSLDIPTLACHCWTDSAVALAWLSRDPSSWKTFVAHRVAFIRSRFPPSQWCHVPTADNPADCASRGLLGAELASHPLWWRGPSWLRLGESDWPVRDFGSQLNPSPRETRAEARTTVGQAVVDEGWDLASRFSTWPRLVRVTAYVMRFVDRCRCGRDANVADSSPSSGLTADECQRSKLF